MKIKVEIHPEGLVFIKGNKQVAYKTTSMTLEFLETIIKKATESLNLKSPPRA